MIVRWHVYQLCSETGELLYVGYSRRLKGRLGEHRREKSWWSEVADIRLEEFVTEDEARQREKALWAGNRPKYNRVSPFHLETETWKSWGREESRERQRRHRVKIRNHGQQTGPGLF